MADDNGPDEYRFDLAVSFAGEQRDFVSEVVRKLNLPDGRVFYDEDFKAEMWGEDLTVLFTDIYSKQAKYVVMFISRDYAEKEWTRHERRAALARRLKTEGAYVLPVRMDSTELSEVGGLLDTIGYVDALREGVDGLVNLIEAKVLGIRHPWRAAEGGDSEMRYAEVADSQEGIAELVHERPRNWQWALFASVLVTRKSALSDAIRDHGLGYARMDSSRRVDNIEELKKLLLDIMDEVEQLGAQLNNFLLTPAFQQTFGEPGHLSDDPEGILHVANRVMDFYEEYLGIARRARATRIPSRYLNVVDTFARLVDKPLAGFDEFISVYVDQIGQLPELLESAEGGNVEADPIRFQIHMDNELAEKGVAQLRVIAQEEGRTD